jgi:hypothetical protein
MVSSIDAYGQEGIPSRHALQVNPPPLPPPDLSTLPGVVLQGTLTLEWPALDGAVSYQVQLWQVQEGEVDLALHDLTSEQPNCIFENLQPGAYRLSINGLDAYGVEGFLAWQNLRVILPPRVKPVLAKPLFGPGWMAFTWTQVEEASGYRFSVARDEGFSELLFERFGQDRYLRLPFYWRGRIFVRVDALFDSPPVESQSGTYRIELPWR